MPDTNPRKNIFTAKVRQRTKKTSRRKKVNEVCRTMFGSTQLERNPGLLPPWLLTGNYVLEVDGANSGEAEEDIILELSCRGCCSNRRSRHLAHCWPPE